MANVVDKIGKECCGCGACVNACPKDALVFKEDSEGFAIPWIDRDRCVDCSVCVGVCPVVNQFDKHYPDKVFAVKNLDQQERLRSSSGGVFLPLAREIVRRGGVVFGVEFAPDFRSARHAFASDNEGILRFSGSKYLQSDTGDAFLRAKEFLESGIPVLYTGTPCQIAGLKHYLRKDYGNLFTVDLVCHGVPSPMVWRKYLDSLSLKDISWVDFRDKCTGWKRFSLVVKDGSGNVLFSEREDDNVYMQGFLKNLYLRPSCYRCPSRRGRSGSDLTIADYWGVKKYYPYFDDNDGVGLVLVNTARGLSLFESVRFESIETAYHEAIAKNPAIERNFTQLAGRETFFERLPSSRNVSKLIGRFTREPFKKRFSKKMKRFFRRFM